MPINKFKIAITLTFFTVSLILISLYQQNRELKKSVEQLENETATPTPTIIITPLTTPTPTKKSLRPSTISLLSTKGWLAASLSGANFKIPANNSCNSQSSCKQITNKDKKTSPINLKTYPLTDQSLDTYYISLNPGVEECHPLTHTSNIGNHQVTEVAVDNTICQGDNWGGLIIKLPNQIFVVEGLSYQKTTLTINRNPTKDTLISTLIGH